MNNPMWITFAATIGVLLIFIMLAILFFLTLRNTLRAVEPVNRTMPPEQVWYLFIPIFNVYWIFRVIAAIADSAKTQLELYGIYKENRPTYATGIAWAISFLLARIPVIQIAFSFVSLILWIIYWVQVNSLKKELLAYGEMNRSRDQDSIL